MDRLTRLKHILLAGALVPALVLPPLVPAGAQDAGPGEPHGKRHEGARHGEAGAPEHKGERGGERRAGGHDEPGAPAKAKRAAGDEDAPRGEKHRKARGEANEAAPAAEKAQNREDRPQRREAGDHDNAKRAKDHDPGEQRQLGSDERHDQRKQGREDRRDERKLGNDEHRDQRQQGTEERRDERKLGNDERRDQRKQGREDRRDERRLGNDERRDQRKLGDEDRRDDRKLGNDERRDDRRLGREDRRDERRMGKEDRRDEDRRDERRLGREERGGPGGPAVGFAGGFMAPTNARSIDQLRRDRREVREGDRTFIREPGRTIVEERGRTFIVHDESDRFRALGYDVRRERRGDQFIETTRRPNGDVILSYTDESGRLLRRVRRGPGGREVVLIENGVGGRVRPYEDDVVVLPPPPMRIPRDRYVVDYAAATPALIYDTLVAPPLAPPPQRYTLDQIRYSPDVRNYVRQVDINTINFDTGSWEVPHSADGKLEALADAMNKAIDRNQNSVFLVEGYTDATGNPTDNLSLSDRRAQSVAEILTKDFKIPPENLTTQGYGQQNLKVDTQGPSAANRRVVVRNITQLLASGGEPTGQ